jgi:hypothetical protein
MGFASGSIEARPFIGLSRRGRAADDARVDEAASRVGEQIPNFSHRRGRDGVAVDENRFMVRPRDRIAETFGYRERLSGWNDRENKPGFVNKRIVIVANLQTRAPDALDARSAAPLYRRDRTRAGLTQSLADGGAHLAGADYRHRFCFWIAHRITSPNSKFGDFHVTEKRASGMDEMCACQKL